LWLIKVWFSASTFVVKIATFAKPETVGQKAPFGRLLPNVPAAPPSVGEGLPSVALRPTDGFAKSQKKSSASPTFFPGLRKAAGTLWATLKYDISYI
jgi:hypothetical protein